jgi:hypothetical protein
MFVDLFVLSKRAIHSDRMSRNTDIDESNCIVVETRGSEVGRRSARLAGSKNPWS